MSDTLNNDLKAIIATFDDSDWEELHFKSDGLEISLSKGSPIRRLAEVVTPASAAKPSAVSPAAAVPPPPVPVANAGAAPSEIPEGLVAIRAPNLGTFYRAPKPGAAPYVEVGQTITPDSDVCLIEIMKLFTPVKAGISGIVREVLVEDAGVVEFDQPLVLVEPV